MFKVGDVIKYRWETLRPISENELVLGIEKRNGKIRYIVYVFEINQIKNYEESNRYYKIPTSELFKD